MNTIFLKISAVALSFLVLFSTLSLTVEKHFCNNFLVDISYFGNSKGCADEFNGEDCDSIEVIKKTNCCKDEIQFVRGQEDLQTSSLEKLDLKQQFVLAFVASYQSLFQTHQKQDTFHYHYSPPNLVSNFQVLHQVFII